VCHSKKSYAEVAKSVPQRPAKSIFQRISFPDDYVEKKIQAEFSTNN
jgi:hypothetical protein